MIKNPLMQHLRFMLKNRGRQLKPKRHTLFLKYKKAKLKKS